MKKKLLAVLMTGIMAMSFAATTTAVYAKGDDDNTLTVWAWDQNFNIKAMNIAGEQYAKDHEGFKVDVVETSSDDCQTKLTTAANAGDYSTLPDIVLMQDNSYQKYLKSYPDAFTDLKDMDINWDDFGKQLPAIVQISWKKQDIPLMILQISHGANSWRSEKTFTKKQVNISLQVKQQVAIL